MRRIITTIAIASILVIGTGTWYYFIKDKNDANRNPSQTRSQPAAKKDIRETVWQQMSNQQKATIAGSWQDGKVSQTTLQSGAMMLGIKDKSYEGKEVYVIQLPRKQGDVLGDTLTVYADTNTHALIGYGVLD